MESLGFVKNKMNTFLILILIIILITILILISVHEFLILK